MQSTPRVVQRETVVVDCIHRVQKGELRPEEAAERLEMSTRNFRRLRKRHREGGLEGLMDRRRARPAHNRCPEKDRELIIELWRSTYWKLGYSVRHFASELKQNLRIHRSYSFVHGLLQAEGLLRDDSGQERYRRPRERRAHRGELLHIDGTRVCWGEGDDRVEGKLIVMMDDATGEVLYARIAKEETTQTIITGLQELAIREGVPKEVQTDRAAWAFGKARGDGRKENLTAVGRLLYELDVKHYASYSPEGRGRSERMNGTLKRRLLPVLRSRGARTIEDANRVIEDGFLKGFNEEFAREPYLPNSYFMPYRPRDPERLFCLHATRKVTRDHVIRVNGLTLRLPRNPRVGTCVGRTVDVYEQLDGSYVVRMPPPLDVELGRYDATGELLERSITVRSHLRLVI